ncbi:hypothetical protein Nepgr_020483 [Nepenthes gracilis]|uniref:Uncharacterized protein n=1 Tax=Nepenthes gracilis TaxID=150966 RepID=A0AAD3XV39_NEPGR|nr:hypothetical protein Nepgr_020483 [Nepenthes gracilis]
MLHASIDAHITSHFHLAKLHIPRLRFVDLLDLFSAVVDINERLCNDQRCLYPQKPLLKLESGTGRARDGLDGALTTEDSGKSAGLTVDPAGAPTAPLTSSAKLYQSMAKEEKLPKIRVDSIEDEVWNLLHESLVYYCGNPVGTIAINDQSSISILNYDWNWEKTMDCHNPGQG